MGKLFWVDQFFITFVEFRLGRSLVRVNPFVPMFFESDVDVKVDNVHGPRIPDSDGKKKKKSGRCIFVQVLICFGR